MISDKNEKLYNYDISHLLYNNIMKQFKSRSIYKKTPPCFPYEDESNMNASIIDFVDTDRVSCNINIILNSAALTENFLETILISPLGKLNNNANDVNEIALNLFINDLSRISSLQNYFDYYNKIYQIKIKELISIDEMKAVRMLFELRHMIIHASALRAKAIIETNGAYIYINDPFYIELLNNVKKLMKSAPDYYCLPDSLFAWNNLIDELIISTARAQEKILQYSKKVFPNIKYDMIMINLEWMSK